MRKMVVAASNSDDARAFISRNLKIADKGLENAIRHILFDANNVIDWDKAVEVFKEYMPELVSTSIEVDFDKCALAAANIINDRLNDMQRYRLEEVDLSMYEDAEMLADDLPTLLYIKYGLEDGEDYQLMNGLSIIMVNPRNPIWAGVRADLSE